MSIFIFLKEFFYFVSNSLLFFRRIEIKFIIDVLFPFRDKSVLLFDIVKSIF